MKERDMIMSKDGIAFLDCDPGEEIVPVALWDKYQNPWYHTSHGRKVKLYDIKDEAVKDGTNSNTPAEMETMQKGMAHAISSEEYNNAIMASNYIENTNSNAVQSNQVDTRTNDIQDSGQISNPFWGNSDDGSANSFNAFKNDVLAQEETESRVIPKSASVLKSMNSGSIGYVVPNSNSINRSTKSKFLSFNNDRAKNWDTLTRIPKSAPVVRNTSCSKRTYKYENVTNGKCVNGQKPFKRVFVNCISDGKIVQTKEMNSLYMNC